MVTRAAAQACQRQPGVNLNGCCVMCWDRQQQADQAAHLPCLSSGSGVCEALTETNVRHSQKQETECNLMTTALWEHCATGLDMLLKRNGAA
jgi:hypothetical protein